jgi:hypothetical protein
MAELPRRIMHGFAVGLLALGATLAVQCGSDEGTPAPAPDGGNPEHTGQSCTPDAANLCYPAVDGAALHGGPAVCLDRVTGGYCTHLCTTDADCCAVPGECLTSLKQLCAPFESTGQMLCFLSCDDRDIATADAGADATIPTDPDTYCKTEVTSEFLCRSTGGGAANRKVCVPGGGGPDAADAPFTTVDGPDAAEAE